MGLLISADGGSRVSNVVVSNTTIRNVCINSGHAVMISEADHVTLDGLVVHNPAGGNCIEMRQWTYLTIRGGCLTQALNGIFCRGIHVDEYGGLSGTWTGLSIKDVQINMLGNATNSGIYLNPTAAVSMSQVSVSGMIVNQVTAGDYITVGSARVSTRAVIANNISLGAGNTVNPSSSSGVIVVANNN